MSITGRLITGVAVFALAFGVHASAAQATAAKPQLLSMLPGTWNCTYKGPKGTVASTITFTRLNDMWVQDTEKDGAYGKRPAHAGAGMMGYDSTKHQYVSMGGSTIPGDWGVGTANAAPDAMDMTFINAYPADPTHDKSVYHFSATKVTSSETWTKSGKVMSGQGVCTKQ